MQAPAADAVEAALKRLLASPQFAGSPRARRFLQFVVQAALGGRAGGLKEYLVGVEVFDRAASFDPRIDTIVRVEAVKLRKRVQDYYRGPGRKDPVIIDLPKGGYAPRFRLRTSRSCTLGQSRPSLEGKAEPFSVAVLPFANLSLDADQEYWSDGLTDELIAALSRLSRIRTISRSCAFAFKGKPIDVREAGRLLDADVIVEGSVRMQGGRVRVTAQLTQVSTGFHLWSDTFEREKQSAWGVQEEIAKAIVSAVDLELTPEEQRLFTKTYTRSPEAFELYLQGRYAAEQIDARLQRQALILFERAIVSDPAYAMPLIGVARCAFNLARLAVEPPGEVALRARCALRRALVLEPELAEAHGILGSLTGIDEWNWSRAEHHFKRALELAPNSAEVHNEYGRNFLALLWRFDEAFVENRRARELDPFSPSIQRAYAWILLMSRRFEEAEGEFRRIMSLHPDAGFISSQLAMALLAQNRDAEAATEFEAASRADATPMREALAGYVQARSGKPGVAEEALTRLKQRSASEFVPSLAFAFLHFALGREEEGFADLDQALLNREQQLSSCKVHFIFDPLREHAKFHAILRQMHLI